MEHETDEVSEKSDVMKSGPDAGENPFARVNGLIADLIQDTTGAWDAQVQQTVEVPHVQHTERS